MASLSITTLTRSIGTHPDLTSRVAAELGALAWEIAYERWIDTANGDDFSELARRALGELPAATALC